MLVLSFLSKCVVLTSTDKLISSLIHPVKLCAFFLCWYWSVCLNTLSSCDTRFLNNS